MRGTVFREIADQRMRDARVLLNAKRYNGAIYLAGYAIECHLKYSYCARRQAVHLPPQYETHRWDKLVEAAGVAADLKSAPRIFDLYSALGDEWEPSLRYETRPYPQREALQLYKEFDELYKFLRESVP